MAGQKQQLRSWAEVASRREPSARQTRGPWRRPTLAAAEREKALTSRERQVLSFLAEGLGTAAIADRLAISRTTVRNHTQRILAKLDVHSRLAAVLEGYAAGVIAIPSRDTDRSRETSTDAIASLK